MKVSRWYHRRDGLFLIFVVVVVSLYYGQGYLFAPGRMSDELANTLSGSDARVDIMITTRFPAEEFHFSIFQRLGVIMGSKDKNTTIYAIEPSNVRMLSRKYWVEWIDLAPKDGSALAP